MRCSCPMTASRVTPPTDEEEDDVEGAEEVRGALSLFVATSIEVGPRFV